MKLSLSQFRAALVLTLTLMSSALVACGADSPSSVRALRFPEFGPIPATHMFADEDPATPEKIELGRDMFFDARLSGSGNTSCTSCHVPETNFQDNLTLPTPDRSYPRDSPTA